MYTRFVCRPSCVFPLLLCLFGGVNINRVDFANFRVDNVLIGF